MVILVVSHQENWRAFPNNLAKRDCSAIARLVKEPGLFHES